MKTAYSNEERYGWSTSFRCFAEVIRAADFVAWAIFSLALVQFIVFTVMTLNQPIIDLWAFRPAQTAVSIPYMLRDGAWFAYVTPVLGEPWIVPFEFPFFQWCVALLVQITGAPIDACGRLVSAFFAVAVLWPVSLLARSLELTRHFTLTTCALWLLAPVVIFFGRSLLIETTIVFFSLVWLAFYVRFLAGRRAVDFFTCLAFGVLAALVKMSGFAPFVVAGAAYTCAFVWKERQRLAANLIPLVLAGTTVLIPTLILMSWSKYSDHFMLQNPLAALLRFQNLTTWYLGSWADRWTVVLWDGTVRLRALPEALGVAWFAVLFGLLRVGPRHCWYWMALVALTAYLSAFLFFPTLHLNHHYYQVENAILLCAAAAIVSEGLRRRRRSAEAYLMLTAIVAGQLWTFYHNQYFKILTDDLREHPYYKASIMLKEVTPPDAVIVGFGLDWSADVPYFAERRGVMLANWFATDKIRQVVFEERDRWFGGRKLGAVIDCAVYQNLVISSTLEPIHDELKRELSGRTIEVTGRVYGATVQPPACWIWLR